MIFGFFMVISTLAAWSAVLLFLYDSHERPDEQPPYEWLHVDGRWEELLEDGHRSRWRPVME